MFHINDAGEAKPCKASVQSNCKFYKGEDDARHYEKAEDAAQASETFLKEQHGSLAVSTNKYSFVKDFRKQESHFKEDFDGFPNRFFNADLKGKLRFDFDDVDVEDINDRTFMLFDSNATAVRLFTASSSTSDMNAPSEEIVNAVKRLGADEIIEVEDTKTLQALGSPNRAWMANFGDKSVAILSNKKGSNLAGYTFRLGAHPPFTKSGFVMTDTRTIMGADRAERKTGVKAFSTIVTGKNRTPEQGKPVIRMLQKLQEAQFEGANFRAQKAHIKEHSGSVATAYMDKKNPDKIRQDLMKNTKLNKVFRKVEIDNDVDPSEFAQFEKDYYEIADKLPPIPHDRKPELRIRKLGKHKAVGVFFPHKNTIAIDVRDSSAFIHEYGHYVDFVVKNNSSLSAEFRQLSKDYSKNLSMPDGLSINKREYYTTPTDVHSRMFEIYAHERLGIDNKLLNPDRFKNFDYEPIMANTDLKNRSFDFFDKVFGK